jgi:hypothetical protein
MSNYLSENSFAAIPSAFGSQETAINDLKICFFVSIAVFAFCVLLCRSRKSFWDVITAKNLIRLLRLFILFELILSIILLNYAVSLGSPLNLHAALSFGNGESWLYNYPRPTLSFILIGFGMLSDMHGSMRFLCLIGSCFEAFCDVLAAYQINDYAVQVKNQSAPSNGYSSYNFSVYYWREILSFGFCVIIFLLTALISCIVGWYPQIIPYSVLNGTYDRCAVMREQRKNRKLITESNTLILDLET